MTDYIQFLKEVLSDFDLSTDANDVVRFNDDAKTPLMIDGKRVVLPTEPHRRSSDGKVLLHPLYENTVADLSTTTKDLTRRASIKLNILFMLYGNALLSACADKSLQKNLNNSQIDLISDVPSCKDSSEKDVEKLASNFMMEILTDDNVGGLIRIGLTRGREYRGEKRHRAAVVEFPLYKALLEDRAVTKKDAKYPQLTKDMRETIIEMHEAIFPACGEDQAYGYCGVTNKNIAPFFVTMMMTFAQMSEALKVVYDTLSPIVEEVQPDFPPELLWLPIVKDNEQLSKWANLIPDQGVYAPPSGDGSVTLTQQTPQKTQQTQQAQQPHVPRVSVPAIQTPVNTAPLYNSQGQLVSAGQSAAPGNGYTVPNTISPQEYMSRVTTVSPETSNAIMQSMVKAYIDGYATWWDAYISEHKVSPPGFVNPASLRGVSLPPAYHNHPPLPPGFYPGGPLHPNGMNQAMGGMPMMQQPAQQLQVRQMQVRDNFGNVTLQNVYVDQWGNMVQPQQQLMGQGMSNGLPMPGQQYAAFSGPQRATNVIERSQGQIMPGTT